MSEHPKQIEELRKHFPHRYLESKIDPSVLLAPGSHVYGDVHIGKDSSIWFNTVLRGDVNYIRIGSETNVQDLTMIHVSYKTFPTVIGNRVTIGHSAIIHACTIFDSVLIGMGSVILDGAEIGENVILGAGSLVTQNAKIPAGTKAFGRPAKVVADLTPEEIARIQFSADHYVRLARTYR